MFGFSSPAISLIPQAFITLHKRLSVAVFHLSSAPMQSALPLSQMIKWKLPRSLLESFNELEGGGDKNSASTHQVLGWPPLLAIHRRCPSAPWIEFCSLFGAWDQEGGPERQLSLALVGGAICLMIHSQKSHRWMDSYWPN